MIDNDEYRELIALRNAIVGKQQATENLNKTTKALNGLQFSLPAPEKRAPITVHTDALIEQFEKPDIDRAKARAKKHDQKANRRKKFLLFLAVLATLAVGAIAIYFIALWSWNTGIPTLMDWCDITYQEAVGIQLFSLSVLLIFSGIIMISNADKSLDYDRVINAFGIVLDLAGVIPFFASFPYYFSGVDGFWEGVWTFLSLIVAIFWGIAAFLFTLPFVGVVIGTVFFVGWIIVKCVEASDNKINTYTKPKIDRQELYKSEGYRQATARDEKATADDRKMYLAYYQDAQNKHQSLVRAYETAIQKYKDIIKECDFTYWESEILHSSQKNLEWINAILYYFELRRATKISDAINLYMQDQHMLRVENRIKGIESKLNEMQKQNARMLREGIDQLSRRLDNIQNSVSSDISKVTSALNNQTAGLQKTLNKLREENRQNSERMIEAERATARELGYLYYETRLQR